MILECAFKIINLDILLGITGSLDLVHRPVF
jgi:hypothetical protein